jgi:hypothetical protein
MLAGKFRRALERAIGANVGVNDSRRGTRGQLVGGTVEVQLAENFQGDTGRMISCAEKWGSSDL